MGFSVITWQPLLAQRMVCAGCKPLGVQIATKSGSASLYLIHYPTGDFDSQSLVSEAKTTFQGPVALAEDFMVLEF